MPENATLSSPALLAEVRKLAPTRAILCTVLASVLVAAAMAWFVNGTPVWLLLLVLLLPVSIVAGVHHDQEAEEWRRTAERRSAKDWADTHQPLP